MPTYKTVLKLLKKTRNTDLKNLDIEKKTMENYVRTKRHKNFYIEQLQFVNDKKEVLKEIVNLNKAKKRADKLTGKKLSKKKKNVLIKIIKKRTELKNKENSSNKFSWNFVISKSVYPGLTAEDKKCLLNLDPLQESPLRLTAKQSHSIAETIKYHQRKGNLPLK